MSANELELLTGTVERARAQYEAAGEARDRARMTLRHVANLWAVDAATEGDLLRAESDYMAALGTVEKAKYVLDDEQRAFDAGHVNTRGAKRRTTERTLRAVAEATRAAVAEHTCPHCGGAL
jgi:uncharacterized protein YaiI (UPF0178 family)